MIDYQAIEAAEAALDAHIAESLARSDPENLAVSRLRRAFVRVWVSWLTEVRNSAKNSSSVTLDATCSFLAGIVAEMATNYWDKELHEEAVEQMLTRIAEEAFVNVKAIRAADEGRTMEGVDIIRQMANLRKKSDG